MQVTRSKTQIGAPSLYPSDVADTTAHRSCLHFEARAPLCFAAAADHGRQEPYQDPQQIETRVSFFPGTCTHHANHPSFTIPPGVTQDRAPPGARPDSKVPTDRSTGPISLLYGPLHRVGLACPGYPSKMQVTRSKTQIGVPSFYPSDVADTTAHRSCLHFEARAPLCFAAAADVGNLTMELLVMQPS